MVLLRAILAGCGSYDDKAGASRASPFHETDDPHAGPAGDALTRRVVMPVDDAAVRDVNPGIGRILPTGELAADKGLEMTIYDAVLHRSAIRPVATGHIGVRLSQAAEPGCEIRIGVRRRRGAKWRWTHQDYGGKCRDQPSWHSIYLQPVHL
jgi:hypothetical protein